MFEIHTQGLKEVLKRIVGWEEHLSEGQSLEALSRLLEQSIITNYQNEGRPSWPKRQGNYPWKILQMTGMKRATELNSTHRPWKREGDGFRLTISSTDYGYLHQMGLGQATRKSAKPTEQEIEEMLKTLLEGFFQ